MKRAAWILFTLVVLAAIGIGGSIAVDRFGDDEQTETTPDAPRATVEVVRTDLIERDTLDGTLRYRDPGALLATGAGTITALPDGGDVLARGDAAYELDGSPVTLMFGARPAWRPIDVDTSEGPDVAQLEGNLWALGFDDGFEMTIDDEVDDATIDAIVRWQESLGRDDVEVVLPSEVVFVPGPLRVGELFVEVGSVVAPGAPLYAISAQTHEVLVLLDADRQDLLVAGDDVTVVLPDDVETRGVVREVSRVVITVGQGPEASRVVEVLIDLVTEGAAGELDEAPVDVDVVTSRAEDVLAVPVEALLALAEGGYAVEIAAGDGTRLVGVEIGTFADGLVEIAGDVAPGDEVVVAE